KIKILDVGSGQGGYSLGALWALKAIFPDKSIFVFAMDGNPNYLTDFDAIHNELFDRAQYTFFRSTHIVEICGDCLNFPDSVIPHKFDLILSSKFLNELYDEKQVEKNPYSYFIERCEELLNQDGFLIINDITRSLSNDEDGKPIAFVGDIMKCGIKMYLDNMGELKVCFPIPCSFYFPRCDFKFCSVFRKFDVQSKYRMKRNKEHVESHPAQITYLILSFEDTVDKVYEGYILAKRYPPEEKCLV
ncbi:MAG: class I SAM-dependent methyltransferase, partial [Thermoplasmata archaeon]|nr:class I SAM-dependent methyltransferase [Thermoplasmata archaeon]